MTALSERLTQRFRSEIPGLVRLGVTASVISPAVRAAHPERVVTLLVGHAPGGGSDIVNKIHADVLAILQSPVTKRTFAAQGLRAIGGTPEAFGRYLAEEVDKHYAFFRALNIQ